MEGAVIVKLLILIFLYMLTPSLYAADAFDAIEKILLSQPIEKAMYPWEKNLSKSAWKSNLENCYDRNSNQSAKTSLLKMLNENGLSTRASASARDKDKSLNMYCSHVLSLANELGFKISIITLDSSSLPAVNRASLIKHCYDFRKNGFTQEFRDQLEFIIGAGAEALNIDQATASSIQVVAMMYAGTCGIMFSYDKGVPVHVSFSENRKIK